RVDALDGNSKRISLGRGAPQRFENMGVGRGAPRVARFEYFVCCKPHTNFWLRTNCSYKPNFQSKGGPDMVEPRGRKSKAQLSVVAPVIPGQGRPQPPKGMPADEAVVWEAIVGAMPDHWLSTSFPVLRF